MPGNRQHPGDLPLPPSVRQSDSARPTNTALHTARASLKHGQHKDASSPSAPGTSPTESSEDRQRTMHQSPQNITSGRSRASVMSDAREWFNSSNNNPTAAFDVSLVDAVSSYFEKRESSSDDAPTDIPLMSPQIAPPFVPPGTSFLSPALAHATTRSSSSEDYRSVIDDLTIENKRLKEQLKRYKQSVNKDVLESEKLFEIKMHGLPRRKKQELEATLRDFAAGLGDTPSTESASQHKNKKSSSSKEHSNHAHHRHHHNNSTLYSSTRPSYKHASVSSSRSRPVDSAYASMSIGAHSAGTSLTRPPFGGSKARSSSDQKVERYLKDIPEGLHPHYGFNTLGDKEKKKLIVRRLEQLFTGKIGGRYTRHRRAAVPKAGDAIAGTLLAAVGDKSTKISTVDDSGSGSGNGSSGDGGGDSTNNAPAHTSTRVAPVANILQSPPSSSEPAREARIESRHSDSKQPKSRDNMSTSNSNSNGEEAGNGSGHGHGNASVSGTGGDGSHHGPRKHSMGSSLPDQRPTRPLDLDPNRAQVPEDNMEYIRHLGLVPPEIGPKSVAKAIDVSPDTDGWVYLNLLANLAQLHIFNVAPDFIRQAVVEKSTKFQLSPDGQKIRWRGGTDGTKFSSDGSSGDLSQNSQSTDFEDGSDETGQRKRAKTSGHSSMSELSSSKKQSKLGLQDSDALSSFQYKPLFVHRNPNPVLTSGEETSSQDADQPEIGRVFGSRIDADNGNSKSHNRYETKSKSHANGNSKINSNVDSSRYTMSRSGSSNALKKHKPDGVVVYYSGMPFCTDLAGDSSREGSPSTFLTSTGNPQDSMDEVLQGRPTVHRSSSGSHIPFRPLTDYLSLSRDEWAGLGLLGIGTVGRQEAAVSPTDNMSSSTSYMSSTNAQDYPDDDLIVLDYSSGMDASSVVVEEPPLEASGINRVFPDDHFAVRVTTQRPFGPSSCINAGDDGDDDNNDYSGGAFSMSSLKRRVAALKKQAAPVSAAVAMKNKAPSVAINYMSAVYDQREPVKLPSPAMFYPPFSQTSESEGVEDMLDSEGADEEDESILSSSVISRRANPHQSVLDVSMASPELMSSGEEGDVEADESGEAVESEDSM